MAHAASIILLSPLSPILNSPLSPAPASAQPMPHFSLSRAPALSLSNQESGYERGGSGTSSAQGMAHAAVLLRCTDTGGEYDKAWRMERCCCLAACHGAWSGAVALRHALRCSCVAAYIPASLSLGSASAQPTGRRHPPQDLACQSQL